MYVTSLKGVIAIAFDEWRGNPHPWIFESMSDSENLRAVFSSVTGTPPLSWLGFRWQFKPNLVIVVLPDWSFVVSTLAVAAIPWLPARRFSLQTLLIAITATAMILGLVVWSIRG